MKLSKIFGLIHSNFTVLTRYKWQIGTRTVIDKSKCHIFCFPHMHLDEADRVREFLISKGFKDPLVVCGEEAFNVYRVEENGK